MASIPWLLPQLHIAAAATCGWRRFLARWPVPVLILSVRRARGVSGVRPRDPGL